MTYTVTITSQGQVSIPAKVRRELGLDKTKRALLSVEDGKIIFEPVPDFLSLKGSVKSNKKPLSNDELHDIVAQAVADEYEKDSN